MNWFVIALIGPFLWSVSNFLDKLLLSRYLKDLSIGALMIFSSLIGVIVLPLIVVFKPEAVHIPLTDALLIMTAGISLMLGFWAYMYALAKDEASIVAPLFQAIPIFLYILGKIFLKEDLNTLQIVGGLLIIGGGGLISWNVSTHKFKSSIFWLMLLASFLIAVEATIFKTVALENDFWAATFWEYAGAGIVGLFTLAFFSTYRKQFFSLWKRYKGQIIGINIANELITVIGVLVGRFAMLLAPIALVQSVNGFQALFILLIGIVITKFFPELGKENIDSKHLIHKFSAIIIMVAGAILIELNS